MNESVIPARAGIQVTTGTQGGNDNWAPTSAGATTDKRWFVPELITLPLAARRCLVRNALTGAALELSSGEHAVLATCEGCHTLAEHEARAATRLRAPEEHIPAIRELLGRCARQGLFVSLPALVARFALTPATPLPPFAGIVVRTADRSQQLRRLLASGAALQSKTEVAYSWHVVDDSRHEANRRTNRQAMAEHRALEATHHDLSARSLEAELCAAFPDVAEEVRWLLGPANGDEVTYGRPQNYFLLRFAGRRLLVIDDDVVLDPRRPPLAQAGVELTVQPEAGFWYESLAAAEETCPPLDLDPFAAHLTWLGLQLSAAWAQAQREPRGLFVGELPRVLCESFHADA